MRKERYSVKNGAKIIIALKLLAIILLPVSKSTSMYVPWSKIDFEQVGIYKGISGLELFNQNILEVVRQYTSSPEIMHLQKRPFVDFQK